MGIGAVSTIDFYAARWIEPKRRRNVVYRITVPTSEPFL